MVRFFFLFFFFSYWSASFFLVRIKQQLVLGADKERLVANYCDELCRPHTCWPCWNPTLTREQTVRALCLAEVLKTQESLLPATAIHTGKQDSYYEKSFRIMHHLDADVLPSAS